MLCRIFFALTLLVPYALGCLVLNGCNLRCPDGYATDKYGCDLCRCRVCGPDPCPGTVCLIGRARDKNGCRICGCKEPCSDIQCIDGHACQLVKDYYNTSYIEQCVRTVTDPPCPPLKCVKKCEYGTKLNKHCRTCDCYDPCEGLTCRANETCIVYDCAKTGDCRDYDSYCGDPKRNSNAVTVLSTPKQLVTQTQPVKQPITTQEAMIKCCANASLNETCLKTCLTNPSLLMSDYNKCIPSKKLWAYLFCITRIQNFYWKQFGMNGQVKARRRPRFGLSDLHDGKTKHTSNRSDKSWPEAVGMDSAEAENLIKSEFPMAIFEVLSGSTDATTSEFISNRVKLYVDDNNIVFRVPTNG